MMRLIDADELKEWIRGQCSSPSCPSYETAFGTRIIDHITKMSSEIINCKDCKHHWVYINDGFPMEMCEIGQAIYDPSTDYCGFAERKTMSDD